MKKNKEEKSNFFGEHTEKLFWPYLVNDAALIVKHLKEFLSDGKIMYRFPTEKGEDAALAFPGEGPIQALNTVKDTGDGFQFTDCVPLLKGSNFPITISDAYTWKNSALGEFSADIEGKLIEFFDPFFALDSKSKEKKPTVSLSAVALYLQELEEKSFVVDKGGMYDYELQEFLKKNPDKTEKDFKAPVVNLTKESFRMLVPTKYSSECEIVAGIEKIEHTSFLGVPIHILTINLEHGSNNEYFTLPLYVTDKVLNGYVPKVGDAVSGVVWFQGYFN